jgi:6-phosphogluconolactonase (cycloisomerase 2 family)
MLVGLTAAASETGGRPSNVVYVETNESDPTIGNAVLAYTRASDGSLTLLGTFPTGGTGISPTFALGPFDSDQNVIVNRDHTLLFAVNGGSDTIAVFKIAGDGTLTPVDGSPFPSGGSNPVSVGLDGDVLCVVNKDQDPNHPGRDLPNYTAFHVSGSGKLTPIKNSTVTVDLGASPSQSLTDPAYRLLFGADFMGGVLRSFSISKDGRLIPKDAQELPPDEFGTSGAPPFPLGLAHHPSRRLLYVGFVTINRMGVYSFSTAGRLNFLRTVENSGMAICWIISNKEGTRLYTSNTADNSISVYDTTGDPTEPVEIQHVVLNSAGACFQIGLDPSESFLHVVTQRSSPMLPQSANALHVLKVNPDGTVTEVPSSPTVLPVPADGTRSQGVAAL